MRDIYYIKFKYQGILVIDIILYDIQIFGMRISKLNIKPGHKNIDIPLHSVQELVSEF